MEPLRDRDVPQATAGFQRLLMEEPVGAVAGSKLLTVAPNATVAEAARLMKQEHFGCVLVVADELLVGIYTERDLLLGFAGTDKNPEETLLRDVMTRAPETVEPSDSLRVALNRMSVGGYRHIPITEGSRVSGLITAKDALRFLAREVLYKDKGSKS
jgi:CBS domain-containing protein